jgi:UDP-N-acetyl-D-mannosaminuronate dehydrogenase
VRLARARFAEAFLVPTSALARVGNADRVLLVAPTGRAEVRSVTVADRTAADAVITQGLDAGDAVIIETSQPVGAGARVRIVGAMHE